jgi:hypothetical protein
MLASLGAEARARSKLIMPDYVGSCVSSIVGKGETGDVQILFVPQNAASVLYALPFALTLTDDRAIRTGHLPIPMQKAFEACEAGNNFTFRSMSFSKLSVDEVREHVEGQQIRDSSAPEITSPAP